jgi:TolB-like protein
MSLLGELKRRNVFRVAMFYAVAAWVLLQVGDLLFGALGVPPWGLRLLLGLLLLGFPLALVFAWIFELTPEGLKREREVDPATSITGRTAIKLDILIAVLLVIAIAVFVADRFINHRAGEQQAAPVAQGTAPPTGPSASSAPAAGPDAASASIAVLPFVNMSEDKANEYFSDGLTEELLNVLANVPGLRVIARTSSFAYKGKEVKIADVARDLNVDHVLEGSVRKSGNRVRITTQLIRSSDSSHLWSETYDRDLNDIFAVQDEISSQVVDALKVRLLKPASSTAETGGTQVATAYEAYLKGRHLRHEGEAESTLRGALAAFDEATRLDPAYARAYAGKADALSTLASNAYISYETGFEQSRQAAKRALELAPDLAEAFLATGLIQWYVDMDLRAAGQSIARALQLNPGSYDVQLAYSTFESSSGQHERAIAAAEKAVALDPIAPGAYVNLAGARLLARQYAGSEAAARRAIALAPDRPAGHYTLGWALMLQNRSDEALAEFNKESIGWQRTTGRALVFARTGKADQARAEVESMLKAFGEAASYQYAQINAALGNRDEAFRWLATARRVHDPGLAGWVFPDPIMDPLRSDPRYDTLVRELGYAGKQ